MATTGSAPGLSSWLEKDRPSIGSLPSVANKLAETLALLMRTGSPLPARFMLPADVAAIPLNDRACSRKSRKSPPEKAPKPPF